MQPKPFPESQNHGDWRKSKSRRPFFRSLLGAIAYTLSPILFAQGAMLAGLFASRVLNHGEKLLSFKLEAGSFVAFFVFVIFGPLLMFASQMARTRRKGLADYGLFAQRYVEGFQEKWILSHGTSSEELLGTGDIQSLADLGNSYSVVQASAVTQNRPLKVT